MGFSSVEEEETYSVRLSLLKRAETDADDAMILACGVSAFLSRVKRQFTRWYCLNEHEHLIDE